MKHNTHSNITALITLLGIAVAAAPAQAQLAITSFTIDGGGASSTGFVALSGTIGQPDASRAMTGGGFALAGGFWANATPVPTCTGDLDGDTTVGAPDLAILLGAWGTANPVADLNDDGTVNAADLGILLGSWGPCVA